MVSVGNGIPFEVIFQTKHIKCIGHNLGCFCSYCNVTEKQAQKKGANQIETLVTSGYRLDLSIVFTIMKSVRFFSFSDSALFESRQYVNHNQPFKIRNCSSLSLPPLSRLAPGPSAPRTLP